MQCALLLDVVIAEGAAVLQLLAYEKYAEPFQQIKCMKKVIGELNNDVNALQ